MKWESGLGVGGGWVQTARGLHKGFRTTLRPPHIFSLRSNKRGPRARPLASWVQTPAPASTV